MKTSLERKVTLGFAAAVLMLCVLGIVSYKSIQQFITRAGWDDHSRLVITSIADLSNEVTEVESSARGYVISGDQRHLAKYGAAVNAVSPKLRQLRDLTRDNPQQQERVDHLDSLVAAKLAVMQRTVDLRTQSGFEAAQELVRTGESARLMDDLRRTLQVMKSAEADLLAGRSAAEQTSATRTIAVISFGSVLAFVLVALSGWMIRRDIAARRGAESALREGEERFRLLIEGVRDYAVIMLDPDGNVVSWNTGAERIKGYKAEEVVGRNFSLFYGPEDLKQRKPERELRTASEKGRYEEEGWRVRKDGRRFWANVVLSAVRDQAGALRGFAKVTRDITERKRAEDEIRQLNESLRQHAAHVDAANKELESFSYSVSHDLRAPLRSIDGFSQVLMEDFPDKLGEEGNEALQRVRAATQRMGQLIDDMLNLSQVTRSEMRYEIVDLTEIVRAVVAELRKGQPERDVEVVIPEAMTAIGDARLLRVAVDNLLGNAWKFTGRTSHARIEFGASPDGAFYVRDNGAGFDMRYAAKLFGAFQRLHAMKEFSGTGVGLATVQRIIHRHGGQVWAHGSVGEGAVFFFTLPTAESHQEQLQQLGQLGQLEQQAA